MSDYGAVYDAIAAACQHYEKDADGFCTKCGWGSKEAVLERDLKGCNEYVQQLQGEVDDLVEEYTKLRKLCAEAAELLHMSGDARDWLMNCMRLRARLQEALDI